MPYRLAVDLRPLLEPYESGVQQYLRALLKELSNDKRWTLELFYQARTPCERIQRDYPNVRHYPISNSIFHIKWLFGVRDLPKDFFERIPDLIWLPDRRPFYKSGISLVMTVHDLSPEKFPRFFSIKGRIWHILFPLKSLLKNCSALLVPSFSVAAALPRNLLKEVTFEGASLSARGEFPLMPKHFKKPFFFMLAPADPRKRVDWMLKVAAELPKVNFIWAGLKENDARFARLKLHLPKNVFSLNQISEEVKKALFKEAEAFLALSSYEGFDLPVLEAVKAKCPVILSDIAVHQELYRNATFVRNPDELKIAIIRALNQKLPVPKPRGDYSWKKAAERTSFLFLRVLLNKNRKGSGNRNG